MRIKHYYRFPKNVTDCFIGDELNKTNWDILRTFQNVEYFSIPNDQKSYDNYCESRAEYGDMAKKIISNMMKNGLDMRQSICSLGCGIGILEWYIKKYYPLLKLCCSDYAENALKKVQDYLNADEFMIFDMNIDDYIKVAKYDWLLIYRVSTEFDFDAWSKIFKKMHESNCKNICFVPSEFATEEDEIREKHLHEKCAQKGEKDMRNGWLYSKDEFEKMFSKWYLIKDLEKINNTGIMILSRNDNA